MTIGWNILHDSTPTPSIVTTSTSQVPGCQEITTTNSDFSNGLQDPDEQFISTLVGGAVDLYLELEDDFCVEAIALAN